MKALKFVFRTDPLAGVIEKTPADVSMGVEKLRKSLKFNDPSKVRPTVYLMLGFREED
jgi:hypothetical protein